MTQLPEDFQAALATLAANASRQIQPAPAVRLDLPEATKIDLLKKCFELVSTHHNFQPGQLVKWKPSLQSRPFPAPGDPAIVFKVLDSPIFDATSDAGFTTFREALDIVVGCLSPQGQFLLFHLPSYRFEPFEPPAD